MSEPTTLSRKRELLILAVFTLLLHVPFLRQPVQGDEVHYLDMAQEVLRQPLTPLNFSYVFQGQLVEAAGHPHPPLNAYLAAVPWLVRGRFSLVFSHAFYILFALGISFAAYALAAYFTSRPLWGALLVAASPIVQVNTNTVASPEAPALAFVMAGAAAFFWRRFWIAGIALALAALTALQALALPPILLLAYLLKRERPPRAAWLALTAPFAVLAGWQALHWALTQRLPGAMLFGYVNNLGFNRVTVKAASALALLGHLGVLVTLVPIARRRLWGVAAGIIACLVVRDYAWWERGLLLISVALGVNALLWLWESRRREPVLAAWCLLYFAFAAAAFYAGAARYLLPLTAPMVLLFVLQYQSRPKWLALALGVNLLIGANVSFAAYEFSRVYAEVAAPPGRTFLVNGEWGFRYHMLNRGGRMLQASSVPVPGEWIVSSELSLAGKYGSLAEATSVPVRSTDLWVRTPLRLVDRYAHTGFSSASFGLLPFSFSSKPLDRVTYARTSSFLSLAAAWTPTQFSSRLVYLPAPGAQIRVPLDRRGTRLHFALFGAGRGRAAFSIRSKDGGVIFQREADIDGDLWQVQTLQLSGTPEAILSVQTSSGLRAGWGELVGLDDNAPDSASPPAAGPHLSYLNMGDIRSTPQLLSGWYGIEDGGWRWADASGTVLLKRPTVPARIQAVVYIPDNAPVRRITLMLDGIAVAEEVLPGPGVHTVSSESLPPVSATATATVAVDKTFSPPGDARKLGVIVHSFGFQ